MPSVWFQPLRPKAVTQLAGDSGSASCSVDSVHQAPMTNRVFVNAGPLILWRGQKEGSVLLLDFQSDIFFLELITTKCAKLCLCLFWLLWLVLPMAPEIIIFHRFHFISGQVYGLSSDTFWPGPSFIQLDPTSSSPGRVRVPCTPDRERVCP